VEAIFNCQFSQYLAVNLAERWLHPIHLTRACADGKY
jgi:hypothetical protein